MACLTINPDLDSERNYHGAAIKVSDSSVGPGVWIGARAAEDDPRESILIHLTVEDGLWLERNLSAALAASLRGEEYENTTNVTGSRSGRQVQRGGDE